MAFLNDRGGSPSYHDATLTYKDSDGKEQTTKIEIKARGRYRRDQLICHYPPIRMKFPKKYDHPPLFKGQHKLKLVTHCQDEQYVLREYYLYKAYNLLTERSFLVRLVKINYIDSEGVAPSEFRYAFFIEDEKNMAKRNKGTPLDEAISFSNNDVDRETLTLTHVFNYMIANKDFDLRVRQNLKVITNGNNQPIVVPYDFDWAGMVDASYTKLTSSRKPVYFERRVFQALCRTEEEFRAAFTKFQSVKDQLFAMYKNSRYLNSTVIKESLKYYKNFYRTIGKSQKVEEIFVDSCNE